MAAALLAAPLLMKKSDFVVFLPLVAPGSFGYCFPVTFLFDILVYFRNLMHRDQKVFYVKTTLFQ